MAPRWFPSSLRRKPEGEVSDQNNSKAEQSDQDSSKVERPDERDSKVQKPETTRGKFSENKPKQSKKTSRAGPRRLEPSFGLPLPRSRTRHSADAVRQPTQTAEEHAGNFSRNSGRPGAFDNRGTQQEDATDDDEGHFSDASARVHPDYGSLQQQDIESYSNGVQPTPDDIVVAIMGVTGSGKSTLVSLLSDADIEIGHGLVSCTTIVNVYNFTLNSKRIFLLDTPGFDDTNRSDSEVLKDVAFWLSSMYTKKVPLAGIIYLHRITDVRMQGSAIRNLKLLKELCGAKNLESVILATTFWKDKEGNRVPKSVGQARMKELQETEEFWGAMIERGSTVEIHDGSKDSARRLVSKLVNRQLVEPLKLVIQRQMVDERRLLFETDAGQELQREGIEERKRNEARLAELKSDMESALKDKDKRWQEQIERDRATFESRIQRGYLEAEKLKISLKKITLEKDEKFRALEAQFTRDKAAWEASYEKIREEKEEKDEKSEKLRAMNAMLNREKAAWEASSRKSVAHIHSSPAGGLLMSDAERIQKARVEAERIQRPRVEAERMQRARDEAERIQRACVEAERMQMARDKAERIQSARDEAARIQRDRYMERLTNALRREYGAPFRM